MKKTEGSGLVLDLTIEESRTFPQKLEDAKVSIFVRVDHTENRSDRENGAGPPEGTPDFTHLSQRARVKVVLPNGQGLPLAVHPGDALGLIGPGYFAELPIGAQPYHKIIVEDPEQSRWWIGTYTVPPRYDVVEVEETCGVQAAMTLTLFPESYPREFPLVYGSPHESPGSAFVYRVNKGVVSWTSTNAPNTYQLVARRFPDQSNTFAIDSVENDGGAEPDSDSATHIAHFWFDLPAEGRRDCQ